MFWYILIAILGVFWVVLPLSVLVIVVTMWIRKRMAENRLTQSTGKNRLRDVQIRAADRV